MRTAEEIAAQTFNSYAFSGNEREAMIKIINEARIEAMRECIDEATRMVNANNFNKYNLLKLLDQVK